MKRKSIFAGLLIFILVISVIYLMVSIKKPHTPINAADVKSVTVWGRTRRIVNEDEKQQIIKCFNAITNVRNNKDFAGTTPDAGIVIELKTGHSIAILLSGADFEIQRDNSLGKRISYWGKQPNIKALLYEAREK